MKRGAGGFASSVGEERYRRFLLLAIAVMIVLGISPVFGHHIAESLDAQLLSGDHIGGLCLIALHALLQPVHFGFHLLIAGGVSFAIWDRWRASRRIRETLDTLEAYTPEADDVFYTCGARAGIEPARVRIVPGLPVPAFTAGWLRPVIYAAEDLRLRLTPDQLALVLRHEAAHMRARDPLRLSVLRFLAALLFWIPAIRAIAEDWADEAEIRADEFASGGQPLLLASALVALATPTSTPDSTVGLTSGVVLNRRVRRLLGEPCPRRSHVTWRAIAAASIALVMVWSSGAIMAHSVREVGLDGVGSAHCQHADANYFSHLLCFRGMDPVATCPHTSAH